MRLDSVVTVSCLVDLVIARLHLVVAAHRGQGEAVEDGQVGPLVAICVIGLDGLRPMLLIPHFNN